MSEADESRTRGIRTHTDNSQEPTYQRAQSLRPHFFFTNYLCDSKQQLTTSKEQLSS